MSSHKNETPLVERIMKEMVKGLVILLIFFVVFMLVVVPLLKEKFGIALFGETGTDISEMVTVGEGEISSSYLEDYGHLVVVTASIENTGDRTLQNIALEFDLFDENDNHLGTALGNVTSLNAGDSVDVQAVMKTPLVELPQYSRFKRIIEIS